jgi:2-keto-4-pentenoate hydratase
MIDFNKLAVLLDDAARTGVAVAQLSESHPDLDVTARLCRSAPIEESPRRFSSPG